TGRMIKKCSLAVIGKVSAPASRIQVKALKDQGHHIDHDILKGLAPYRTDHINRFGDYTLDFDRQVSPMSYNTKII
ncbi:transposase, partial [Vreelandella aquamarina]|uniref:transposase n=1 Tax=Vreelandella aquamarina TaxID=77097 RepID=UPI001D18C7FA